MSYAAQPLAPDRWIRSETLADVAVMLEDLPDDRLVALQLNGKLIGVATVAQIRTAADRQIVVSGTVEHGVDVARVGL